MEVERIVMKENKLGIKISLVSIILLVLIILFLEEKNFIRKICSVVLDGGFTSLLILMAKYLTEERKAIYNFYVSLARYVEKLKSFSQFIAEAHVIEKRGLSDEDRVQLFIAVASRMEVFYNEINEEILIIQEETRECEEYLLHLRRNYDIQYYMRKLYNSTKEVISCIINCREMKYHYELYMQTDILKSIYEKLDNMFVSEKIGGEENEFVLIQCKKPNGVLEIFNLHGYISLKGGGFVKRCDEYKVLDISNSNDIKQEHSVCKERQNRVFPVDDWINDI